MLRSIRALLALLGATVLLAACGANGVPGAQPTPTTPSPTPLGPPNFVIILADDLGYGDVGTFGNPLIRTPHLDRLAADGIKLTSFYTAAPVCAPARAGLMTGRWPIRTGIPWNPPTRLNDGELTIADVLRTRGYATGMVGKWHLGWVPPDLPVDHGFDFFYGCTAGAGFYYRGDQLSYGPAQDMETSVFTREAITWVQSVPPDKPFFLYLAPLAPHQPYTEPPAPFGGASAGGIYGDIVEELDGAVGQLVDAIQQRGQLSNTFIIFTSDNGPVIPPEGLGSAGPFTAGKTSCQEGGIREPAVVAWPAHIPGGRTVDEPLSVLDLFPTFLALAGGTLPTDRLYDGDDATALLENHITRMPGAGIDGNRELVFWLSHNPIAIRCGKWKFVRSSPWSSDPALYDLEADPAEIHNLRSVHRDIADTLDARIDALVSR